jgi:RpiR family carbohydrate utilization transcriptional regulator
MKKNSNPVFFREMKESLTPTEEKIVAFIEGNISEMIRLSISELAARCDASESGIVRLCKKMGFKGYQDMKIALAQYVASNDEVKHLQQDVELGDSVAEICTKVFNATVQSLRDTESVLSTQNMEQAVNWIQNAGSINFYGVGGAGAVATDAYFRYLKLGIPCQAFTDAQNQINRSLTLGEKDVIVAISHSGKTRDLLLSLKTAKERGAKIIAVTQMGKTPITKLADLVFYTSSNETVFRHDAMASRIAEMVILDSLFVCGAIKNYKSVVRFYEESFELFESLRVDTIKTIKTPKEDGSK